MLYGAHSDSRLGLNTYDFYFGEAVTAVYKGRWEWKYNDYTLSEQLIRIMDSMISEQVRKFKIENTKTKVTLFPQEQLTMALEEAAAEDSDMRELYEKCEQALSDACVDNQKFAQFIDLKKKGVSYDDICAKMNCSKNEAYQMLETISRRANKILVTL